jgi:hypothetical protein
VKTVGTIGQRSKRTRLWCFTVTDIALTKDMTLLLNLTLPFGVELEIISETLTFQLSSEIALEI